MFYVSLIKNLSFYEYIPLLLVVTLVVMSLTSFLILLCFGYEFSLLFNLISLTKTSAAQPQNSKSCGEFIPESEPDNELDESYLTLCSQNTDFPSSYELSQITNSEI